MDLYGLLGLSRDATADAIERAYRRLARRYHPGVNPGDQVAEALFRQIQEAYDVLSHLERRREYDRGTSRPAATAAAAVVSFEGFDFSAPAEGPVAATFTELFAGVFQRAARQAVLPVQGAPIEIALPLSFEDAIRGGTFPISVVRQERCPHCAGYGQTACPPVVCPACAGQGGHRSARGHMVFTKTCETCEGSRRLTRQLCGSCDGSGLMPRSEVVTITLPPGIESGARVVVPGRGHGGANRGPAGDLYVRVEVAPHRHFTRERRDLLLNVPVAVHEAALGARVTVPTLDGAVKLRIPPGTASGERLRVAGRGVPGPPGSDEAGDLVVTVHIVLPALLDERSKALLREFGTRNDADVRSGLFEN
jgi:molecular chaperone DnaJ